jgi:hypothetical protein
VADVDPRVPPALGLSGEVEPYRGLSSVQRAELLAAACRAAAELLRSRADAERAAAFRDPLPESSVRALARLRARASARRP